MNQKASQTQRINLRDFAVWALNSLGSRRMSSEELLDCWKQVRAHSNSDPKAFSDLTAFVNQWWDACIALFRKEGWLRVYNDSHVLFLTPAGQDYLADPETLLATHKKLVFALSHIRLEERLTSLRDTLCQETELPPFRIFPDTLLAQLLLHRPTTVEELEKISGMGTYKLRKYGQRLLEVLTP